MININIKEGVLNVNYLDFYESYHYNQYISKSINILVVQVNIWYIKTKNRKG